MSGPELLLGLFAGAGVASLFWYWHCRQLREEFEREQERQARLARRSRRPASAPARDEAADSGPRREQRAQNKIHAAPWHRLTVLVVDADAEVRRLLIAWLADRGHRAVPAPDAGRGIEIARRLRFDLVLVEAHLPGADWLKVWEQFRTASPTVALLVSEASPQSVGLPPQLDVPVLRKPVDADQLDSLLGRASSRRRGTPLRA